MRSVGWSVSGPDWLAVVWLVIPTLAILAAGIPGLTQFVDIVLQRKIRLAATGLEAVISFLEVFAAGRSGSLAMERDNEGDLLGEGLVIAAAILLPILTFAFISLWQPRPPHYPVGGTKPQEKRESR